MDALLNVIDECESNIQVIMSLLSLISAAADTHIQLADIEPLIEDSHKRADNIFYRLIDIENAIKESTNE